MFGKRDVDLLSDVASYLGIFQEKKIFEIKKIQRLKAEKTKKTLSLSEDFF